MNNVVRRRVGEGRAQRLGQQFVHSVDRAMGLLRRLTSVVPTRTPSAKPAAPPDRGRATVPPKERMRRLEVARRQLAQELSKQELELEQVHAVITSGDAVGAATGATGDRLTAFMENARRLREKIQEKRLELVRMERSIARERELLGVSAGATESTPPDSPARATVATGATARAKGPCRPIAEHALKAALRQTRFGDRAERVLVEGMAEGLLSDDIEVRRQAVARIGGRPQPATALLLLAADDPDDRVRLAALGGLAGKRGPAVVDLFRRFLRDKSSALRLAALRGLASTDERLLTSSDLTAALEDPDPGVRRAAAAVLGWHREEGRVSSRVIHALGFALYDQDEAVRVSAAEALSTTSNDKTVLSLIRAVGDPSEAVRDASLRSLHSMLGAEVDSVAEAAPPEKRVDALKTWWRVARVRLRAGSTGTASVDAGSAAARDVLQTLASLKAETTAPRPIAAEPGELAPARARDRAASAEQAPSAADVKQASASSAIQASVAEPATNAAKAQPPALPGSTPAQKKKEAPIGAQAEGGAGLDESAAAEGDAETEAFESVFDKTEADKNQDKDEDEGSEDYETIIEG